MRKLTVMFLFLLILFTSTKAFAIDFGTLCDDVSAAYPNSEESIAEYVYYGIIPALQNECEYLTKDMIIKEIRDTVKYTDIKERVPNLKDLVVHYIGYKTEECTRRSRFFSFYDYAIYMHNLTKDK